MKSIMITYPNFRALPKGVKQMLLASESFFFEEMSAAPKRATAIAQTKPVAGLREARWMTGSTLHSSWKN